MILDFPEFQPAFFLRGGHAQTVGAFLLPGLAFPYQATKHFVTLDDGDQIVLHDDCPESWSPGDRVALMIHGLGGSHQSPYMQRIAYKLYQRGIRTFRMDLRGCGAGVGLSRFPCHSGRSDDAAAALEKIAQLCPFSQTTLIGFSLGGNITLKLLGEYSCDPPGNLDAAIAVCPPIDLTRCVQKIQQAPNHFYDRYFVKLLLKMHQQTLKLLPDAPTFDATVRPRRLIELDEIFTARVSGFGDAMTYYRLCSTARLLHAIKLPTLILAAADDPLIPSECFESIDKSEDVHLVLSQGGGHLGFLGQLGSDPDRRWMDWRIVDWVLHHDAQTSCRIRKPHHLPNRARTFTQPAGATAAYATLPVPAHPQGS